MKKEWTILWLIPILLLVMTGCTNNSTKTETADSATSEELSYNVTIELKEGEEYISQKEITVSEGQVLLEVMKKNYELEEDNGMITAIDGVSQDPSANQFWIFTINDEQVNEGAATVTLDPDDRVVFVLETF